LARRRGRVIVWRCPCFVPRPRPSDGVGRRGLRAVGARPWRDRGDRRAADPGPRQVRRPRVGRGLAAHEAVPAGRGQGHRPLSRPGQRPAGFGQPGADGRGPLVAVRRAAGPVGPVGRRRGRRRGPARARGPSRGLPRPGGPDRRPGYSGDLAGGLCAVRGGTAAGPGFRPGPVAMRRHRFAGRPGLCQPAHGAGGQPRGGRALSRQAAAPAAVHAVGPGRVGRGRRQGRPGHHRPLPRAVRVPPAEQAAAAGPGVAAGPAGRGWKAVLTH
jgi:hypothetical protein